MTIGLGVFCAVLMVMYGYLFWSYGWLNIRVAFADDQTQIFEDAWKHAMQSDPAGAIEGLKEVINYYPSGSKQQEGSRLDRVVERARTNAEQEIIAHLRAKTGEDLGEQPAPWIQKYGKH
ncbi:MAG TPA: hypothetical protein VH413_12885 [Verrucomicrobiae bacterium]|nr:hypothetical protein [Verrucomicrobiae bacterium]